VDKAFGEYDKSMKKSIDEFDEKIAKIQKSADKRFNRIILILFVVGIACALCSWLIS